MLQWILLPNLKKKEKKRNCSFPYPTFIAHMMHRQKLCWTVAVIKHVRGIDCSKLLSFLDADYPTTRHLSMNAPRPRRSFRQWPRTDFPKLGQAHHLALIGSPSSLLESSHFFRVW
jgi:hypothetical protein